MSSGKFAVPAGRQPYLRNLARVRFERCQAVRPSQALDKLACRNLKLNRYAAGGSISGRLPDRCRTAAGPLPDTCRTFLGRLFDFGPAGLSGGRLAGQLSTKSSHPLIRRPSQTQETKGASQSAAHSHGGNSHQTLTSCCAGYRSVQRTERKKPLVSAVIG